MTQIQSKVPTDAFRNGHDVIWGSKKTEAVATEVPQEQISEETKGEQDDQTRATDK